MMKGLIIRIRKSWKKKKKILYKGFLARGELAGMSLVTVSITAWKVFVFGVCLVHILPHLDWILRDKEYLSVLSPNAGI